MHLFQRYKTRNYRNIFTTLVFVSVLISCTPGVDFAISGGRSDKQICNMVSVVRGEVGGWSNVHSNEAIIKYGREERGLNAEKCISLVGHPGMFDYQWWRDRYNRTGRGSYNAYTLQKKKNTSGQSINLHPEWSRKRVNCNAEWEKIKYSKNRIIINKFLGTYCGQLGNYGDLARSLLSDIERDEKILNPDKGGILQSNTNSLVEIKKTTKVNFNKKIDSLAKTCSSLGFKKNTPKHGECVLKLMDQ